MLIIHNLFENVIIHLDNICFEIIIYVKKCKADLNSQKSCEFSI